MKTALFLIALITTLTPHFLVYAEFAISGNVTTLVGYQHDNQGATNTVSNGNGAGGLTQGDFRWTPTANADHFGFVIDQVEIDIENEFGHNIRARMDIDFIDLGTPSVSAFILEQAYVTANIGLGHGFELMLGKYNAPFGLEDVDRHENVFITFSPINMFLTSNQVMGANVHYEFNDHWNFDLSLVNSINNTNAGNSAYPSGILRVGIQWGDEGRKSDINIAGGFGPEHNTAVGQLSQNRHFDLFGNAWGVFALGQRLDIGWEALYRQTNSMNVGANQKALAGQLYTQYQFSEKWSVQTRVVAFWEINPANGKAGAGSGASTSGGTWSGFEGVTYSGSVGATYQIIDGAAVKLEYRFDHANVAGATPNANFHTGVAQFSYNF